MPDTWRNSAGSQSGIALASPDKTVGKREDFAIRRGNDGAIPAWATAAPEMVRLFGVHLLD
ncbi:hypothetical protein Apmu_0047_12 [Acidiphilium multivorum AIU301]|jgi:hypothetical protein|nr:hypothetical protein Apmu_0047_12 [Acidiphilium multivorum AIU301]